MKKIIIFAGTTEGRQLSDLLSKGQIPHTVCVAGGYGSRMIEQGPYAKVLTGRLDENGMKELFSKERSDGELSIADATHPYAAEVSGNIKSAAESLGLTVIRIVRDQSADPEGGQEEYVDMESCAKALDETEGNILLTTGSKELSVYGRLVSEQTKKRTYVRVLPSVESLQMCQAQGIAPDHIIAMHGPFDEQLNEALMKQYKIRHLVTKDSGKAGGFAQKLEAAERLGVVAHVLERPVREEGVSVAEAFYQLTGKEPEAEPMRITLAGIGMGAVSCETGEVREAIRTSDMIFGAQRLLKNVSHDKLFPLYRPEDIIPVLEKERPEKALILFSGDTGFYSGAKKMLSALKERFEDARIELSPGISSFAYLSAKLGESYEDACLFSLHGRDTKEKLESLVQKVRYGHKTFALLSGATDISRIAEALEERGIDAEICVGSDLSSEKERISVLTLQQAREYEGSGIVCVLIRNLQPERRLLIPVRKDSDFIRDKVPMTAECIRHESVIRLALREGDVFYDIGGGTGSVAIEAASLHESLSVLTIEKKPEAAGLIRRNIEKAHLSNIRVEEGEATDILGDLPKPDAVFIGGSGGKLFEIVEILRAKGSGIRFVINAVSLETITQVKQLLEQYDPKDAQTVVLSVSNLQGIGSYHMLRGADPIWIFSFTL
ncbi:MAG: precorrin-6A reductase [Lachnospiraceae bacterium]|nr:precorrin-6A reductase [Lachnospiraceae bacterium]